MSRYVLTVDVRDDPEAIAAYREHHRRVWPEVVDSLRTVGVRNMDIHLLGRRLVMVVVMEDGLAAGTGRGYAARRLVGADGRGVQTRRRGTCRCALARTRATALISSGPW